MTTKINTWRPNTCGCIVHYSFDDSVPSDDIVFTAVSVNGYGEPTVRCETHAGIEDIEELRSAVTAHNIEMNKDVDS